jgi:hypothetical protein
MKYLDQQIVPFLFNLHFPAPLPVDFEVLHPFADVETQRVCKQFYQTYYHDNQPRHCIIGINPGRFGAGITGVPFTDPIRLEKRCGIENNWLKKQELSSVFIYDMIDAFGGVREFYSRFYITAISPLGFTFQGKNINYYDNKQLQESVQPFALDCLRQQLSWGLQTNVAFCLGEGKNYRYVQKLNDEYSFFESIVPLAHPRFIMQYKLKQKDAYIEHYLEAFSHI